MPGLDVITIGRSSVDLYGAQVGGRLEDMASFRKYIGGSPTNIAAGTARLGLKSGLITRVGDEHMGRFVCEQLEREGVNTTGVVTDTERLTALVLLGIRDEDQFPLIFYRENCADMALCEDDIDPEYIAQAACVTATGTHLSNPQTKAAVLKALSLAKKNKASTALDIDYRPNLWGLAGHGDGEERFIESAEVTRQLQETLPLFDLIVGTEEEFHIAGGSTNTLDALRNVRNLCPAVLVCKRGPMGAVAFEGEIPTSLDDGKTGPGFPIEVFNVLGAGDGFMSGLLRGWLKDEPWETALTWANACGAFAVSRHGCAPAYPSWEELQWFLKHGSTERALRKDALLEHIHWATNRGRDISALTVYEAEHGKGLKCLEALDGITNSGIILNWDTDREAVYRATDTAVWIGRTAIVGETDFNEWPLNHSVVFEVTRKNADHVGPSFRTARSHGLEVMFHLSGEDSGVLQTVIDEGLRPDWWVLNPNGDLEDLIAQISKHDPWTRGILIQDGASENTNALVKGSVLSQSQL